MSHVKNVQEIRDRARQRISEGALTEDYTLDRDQAVAVLNEALATELVCVLRYKYHYFMATGIHSQAAKAEFLEHAKEEQEHADEIAERIAIESYREMIQFFGERDPTTRRMLEAILAVEEEHADDIADLLFAQSGGETRRLYSEDEVPTLTKTGQPASPGADSGPRPGGSERH